MIDPVEMQDFFTAFFSGALVIVFGALYALLLAWGRLKDSRPFIAAAYLFYAMLVAAVFFLSETMHFSGFWNLITVTMLLGYLAAPHGIWVLCRDTHSHEETPSQIQS
jgi:NhaP-type Na+/H+ or K+/H+ antiporter